LFDKAFILHIVYENTISNIIENGFWKRILFLKNHSHMCSQIVDIYLFVVHILTVYHAFSFHLCVFD